MYEHQRGPFRGIAERLHGVATTDSVVNLHHAGNNPPERVIKWPRQSTGSLEEAISYGRFFKKSIELYSAILGPEYLVPSSLVIGDKPAKGSNNGPTLLNVQRYISGWDGRNLPEDLRTNEVLLEQWRRLYDRLAVLYLVGRGVNRKYAEQGKNFPIELTVGQSRKMAYREREAAAYREVPLTPNLLIRRQDLKLFIGDFGPYRMWDDSMEEPYNEILERGTQIAALLKGLT